MKIYIKFSPTPNRCFFPPGDCDRGEIIWCPICVYGGRSDVITSWSAVACSKVIRSLFRLYLNIQNITSVIMYCIYIVSGFFPVLLFLSVLLNRCLCGEKTADTHHIHKRQ